METMTGQSPTGRHPGNKNLHTVNYYSEVTLMGITGHKTFWIRTSGGGSLRERVITGGGYTNGNHWAQNILDQNEWGKKGH